MLATTHKRDLLYGDSEASRQFREVAERRGYGHLDREDQYSYLAREYDAEVGKSGIGSDLNFAYNVLRGGQTASLGDKIKAASIIALRPGQYAELRRQREGGSEAEAHENAARAVEQQAAGESPVEAAEEESQRPEGEPVADENPLAAMRTETASKLAGEETEEAAEPPAGAGPSRAVRESLQRSVDAHGNAVPIPGVEGGMIIPGGGGQVHVPGPDGEMIPYTAPAAVEEEVPAEGPVATLPEGAVNKATEGWADYHLYKDGTIRFIHPETGEMVTVSETSDPESYSAIKQKAFGEAPKAPAGVDPIDLPATVDFDDGDFEAPVVTAKPGDPAVDPDLEGAPGGLGDDLFAGLGETPAGEVPPAASESPLTFEDQFPTSEQDPRMPPLDAGDVFADRPDNPNIISTDVLKNLPGANLGPMGGLAGSRRGRSQEAAPPPEEEFKQSRYPEGMEDLPQSGYPEGSAEPLTSYRDPNALTRADPLDPRLLAEENVDRLARQSGTAFDVDEGFEPPVVRGQDPKRDFDFGTDTTEDMLKREDPPADLSAERGVSEEGALAMNEPPLGTSPVSSYEPPSAKQQETYSGQDFELQKIEEAARLAGQDKRLRQIDEETSLGRASDVTAEDLGEPAEGQRKLEERERLLAEDEKARREALRTSAEPASEEPPGESVKEPYPTSPQEEDQYPTSQTGSEFARGMEGHMAEPPPLPKTSPEMTASESQITGIPTATKAASPPNLSMAQGATGEATSKRAKHNEALMKTLSKQLAARNQATP